MTVRVSIEEFSVMTRLSRRELQRYRELGLLEAAGLQPGTSTLCYDTSQVPRAQLVRYLSRLDMPLPEIQALLSAPDAQVRNEIIAGHLGRTVSELDKIRETVSTLRTLLAPEEAPVQMEFRSVPNTRAIAITGTVKLDGLTTWWRNSLDELDSALAAAGVTPAGAPGGLYSSELVSEEAGEATVFIPVKRPVHAYGRARITDIPPAELAVTVHDGPYSMIARSYGALGAFVTERKLGIDAPLREYYLVTAANADQDGQQRTEICWPIYRPALL